MTAHVLLVEDHLPLRLSLSASLRQAGHRVTAVASAEEAEQVVDADPPQLVVLDWNLPGRSGLELLASWVNRDRDLPVILLTARDSVNDRVRGLRAGAGDYVVKPFATEELLARVEVQLRRHQELGDVLRLVDRVVELRRERVVRDGVELHTLTTREASLLAYLAARPSRAVERSDLMREVWGYAGGVVTRTIDNTVARLRAKIEADPSSPRHLITVHGTGYRFEPA